MFSNRLFNLLIVVVLVVGMLLTACAPQVEATPNPTTAPPATSVPDKPVTLRLAVADAQGRASEPYVQEFVDQVNTLSKGNISVVPVWDAGADITPPIEQGVIKVVKDSQYELGLAGSRAWDTAGVTSFQALQAPFLITDDALAEAVASGGIGIRMLEGLSSTGITGLGLWPEDLRHPFSYVSGKSILSTGDLEGLAVRTPPSDVSYMLIKALGGNPYFDNETRDNPAAESGMLQVVSSRLPTVTGNLTFFPKFQVLFANGGAFEKLSEGQRSILREAAAATQKKAIAEHPSDAEAARTWCDNGGKVVMASQEQVAAFEAAAIPVLDEIKKDLFDAERIADIQELKANMKPASGAEACQPETNNSEVWSPGLPPNGVWQVELTDEDVMSMGVPQSGVKDWAGRWTWTFEDSKAQILAEVGDTFECKANYEVVGDIVRLTYFDSEYCYKEIDDIQWRLDDSGLHLHLVAIENSHLLENRAMYEAKPWQKVE